MRACCPSKPRESFMTEEGNPWQTLRSKEVYENPWIRVVENQVIHPAGSEGIYGVVHFKNLATGVVPLDNSRLEAKLGCANCGNIPAGARAYYSDVVICQSNTPN